MSDCSTDGGVAKQAMCILSYGGNLTDTTINYTLICFTLAACIHALNSESPSFLFRRKAAALTMLEISLWVFQLALCLVVGCSGVSIIWNAHIGYLVGLLRQAGRETPSRVVVLTVLLGLLVDGYYLLTADELTTTAHVCAACLGYAVRIFVVSQAFPTNIELLLFQQS